MILNDSNLNNIRKVTSAIFGGELSKLLADGPWQEFTELLPFGTSKLDMGWLGTVGEMQIWAGPKDVRGIEAYKYELIPDPYELTVGIHKHKLADAAGTPGEVARFLGLDHVAREMARKAAHWYPRITTDALLAGSDAGSLCYDGVPMFDGSHPGKDANGAATTYSNEDTSDNVNDYFLIDSRAVKPALLGERDRPAIMPHTTGDTYWLNGLYLIGAEARGSVKYGEPRGTFRSTKTMNLANVRAHINTMAAYRDDKGTELGIVPDILLVGRSLRFTAEDLLNKQVEATGESNMGRSLGLRLVYNPLMP